MPEGIRPRVGKTGTGYEASVYLPGGARQYKTFPTEKAAKKWRTSTLNEIYKGKRQAGSQVTVKQAGLALIRDMEKGVARTRSGSVYKPSVIRGYEDSLLLHVYPDLGALRLQDVERRQVQKLVDTMVGAGASPSKVRNAIMPLRVIYRRARNEVEVSPCSGLDMPSVEKSEIRIAAPEEARALIAALPERDRPLWSTAFYAGLRLGELRGLEWGDVLLASKMITVRRGWDDSEGEIDPKSKAGRRGVPVVEALEEVLRAHWATGGFSASHFPVFPSSSGARFAIGRTNERAKKAWAEAGLDPIGLHEARHTFASTAIAAGCNVKELSVYMGHSSITVTLDLYGHLFPGGEEDFRKRMDEYLSLARPVANGRNPA